MPIGWLIVFHLTPFFVKKDKDKMIRRDILNKSLLNGKEQPSGLNSACLLLLKGYKFAAYF
ncbi:hypothetical protein [Sporolactobacillus putidus]|uniref:Uncharacterized protein n=1 Tax=Sporolactobacillus putidus TaxID=492735 RepID=A0A917S381_9BACL|nr:hypothetical protein [Sporolactobacillus putidus]GGL54794.1 hypothetical protein GCM10007968_18570 [Sporolactobacillus putidus]